MTIRNNPIWKKVAALTAQQQIALHKYIFPNGAVPQSRAAIVDAVAQYCDTEPSFTSVMVACGFMSAPPAFTEAEFKSVQAIAERADQSAISLAQEVTSQKNAIININQDIHTVSNNIATTNQKIDGVSNALSSLASGIIGYQTGLEQTIDGKLRELQKVVNAAKNITIDPAAVDAAVNKAVADAFKPFEKAVRDAGAESIVAEMAEQVGDIETLDAATLFGIDARDTNKKALTFRKISGNPSAPAVDTCFIWTKPVLRVFALADANNGKSYLSTIWFGGEKGTGKSETAKQFAARTGRPYFRINFQKFTMLEDVCGSTALENGNTKFAPGVLLRAITTPYAVILLDELTLADPGILGFLNGLLEPGSRVAYGGQYWSRAPGVIVIAADNTFGSGDVTGRYAGTRSQSAALVDRFGLIFPFTYLPLEDEVKAVTKHTGCSDILAEHVLRAIQICRQKVNTGEIIDAPSIRSVVSFIESLAILNVEDAWDSAIAARQPAESAVALKAVFNSAIDSDYIRANI